MTEGSDMQKEDSAWFWSLVRRFTITVLMMSAVGLAMHLDESTGWSRVSYLILGMVLTYILVAIHMIRSSLHLERLRRDLEG